MTNIKERPIINADELKKEIQSLKELILRKDQEITRINKELSIMKEQVKGKDQEINRINKDLFATKDLVRIKEEQINRFDFQEKIPPDAKEPKVTQNEELLNEKLIFENQKDVLTMRSTIQAYRDIISDTEKRLSSANSRIINLGKELDNLNRQTQGTFQPDDISKYLSKAIDQFNSSINNVKTG
ncbi:MAG: hypothetical protein U1C51_09325, partial [Candidatus Izemoplasmatales bacterium]|nr:hypothetical protein [Candidatus Izemoplasmatales bacterium]